MNDGIKLHKPNCGCDGPYKDRECVWRENGFNEGAASRQAEIDELKTELDAVLSDWNALVKAIGSPTHGGAIGYGAQLLRRAESAEAKLAIAAEALRSYAGGEDGSWRACRAALAKIESAGKDGVT